MSEEDIVDAEVASTSISENGEVKTESEYVETRDNFSRVFSAYKRQSAGVIKEFKSKQEYRSRSEWKKLKAENARKRQAKRARQSEWKNRKYF